MMMQSQQARRYRAAFTLLEVLVVVAIILVLASMATVAVLQIQKDNTDDVAKIKAQTIETALKLYMVRNNGQEPASMQDLNTLVEGGVLDPWGQEYQWGNEQDASGKTVYFVYTTNPKTGVQISSQRK
jgi:general secretion pathway protein G